MANKFKVGDNVKFERNFSTKKDSATIFGVLENTSNKTVYAEGVEVPVGLKNIQDLELPPTYIIEHEQGWIPDMIRQSQFGLLEDKKYLYVSENELTIIA